jgi:hypothetical protein
MSKTHSNAAQEISDYIGAMPDFSRAICNKLRNIILNADKNIVEDWKWGPHYSCHGMICGFGAFRHHVKFTFYNGSAMSDRKKLFNHCVDNEFNRSIKYTVLEEIDEGAITQYVKESIEVNKKGFKRVVPPKALQIPDDLQTALSNDTIATKFFQELSPGYQKDFVQWVTSAKRIETRIDRISKVVKMCREKRRMNDQYSK